jgi:hypothetical protein
MSNSVLYLPSHSFANFEGLTVTVDSGLISTSYNRAQQQQHQQQHDLGFVMLAQFQKPQPEAKQMDDDDENGAYNEASLTTSLAGSSIVAKSGNDLSKQQQQQLSTKLIHFLANSRCSIIFPARSFFVSKYFSASTTKTFSTSNVDLSTFKPIVSMRSGAGSLSIQSIS